MSTLIKFRVWDTKLNKYISFDSIPVHDFNSKEYIYQQWIGLYDSEGVEIYNGDLITSFEGRLILVEYYAPEFIFKYKYDLNDDFWSFYQWGTFRGTVSGNILEDKKIYERHFKQS